MAMSHMAVSGTTGRASRIVMRRSWFIHLRIIFLTTNKIL
jgi:hypothetical protein